MTGGSGTACAVVVKPLVRPCGGRGRGGYHCPKPPTARSLSGLPTISWRRTVVIHMKRTNKCPKCGSNDLVADAKAVDRGHYNVETELSVVTFREPEALLFKGRSTTTLSAWICADCGYVELYADTPRSIKSPAD